MLYVIEWESADEHAAVEVVTGPAADMDKLFKEWEAGLAFPTSLHLDEKAKLFARWLCSEHGYSREAWQLIVIDG